MGSAFVNYGGVSNTGNNLIDSLTWGSKWQSASGPLVINVGYYPTVDIYNASGAHTGARAVSAAEISAMQATLAEFSKYINVSFNFIGQDPTEASDIQFVLSSDKTVDYLGVADPPGEHSGNPNFSEVWVFPNNYSAPNGSLAKGGYDYVTFVHEFGHAMGLAHPHDTGGTPSNPSEIMSGVTDAFDSYGAYNLNQGIFTTMSYNDGWALGGLSQKVKGYGFQAGLMALDIQALQHIYGANMNYATGDDSYALAAKNAVGTGYSCIWDADGTDTISMTGSKACVIDLRAATGQLDAGGGGYVSHGIGIRGGFTIAVGVVIENALGGTGADTLIGNDAANHLTGGGGKDVMTGHGAADVFVFAALADSSATLTKADVITDFQDGIDQIDIHGFDANSKVAGLDHFAFAGAVATFTGAGQVRYAQDVVHNQTLVYLNTDLDQAAESTIVLQGLHTLGAGDFILV